MRFTMRSIALATAAVTLVTTGAVAASVSASAIEPAGPVVTELTIDANAIIEADATLTIGLKTVHFRIEQQRRGRAEFAAAVKAKQAARAAKIKKIRARIITVAKKQIGDRYSAGSSGPSAFDCSGFTRYVYRVAAHKYLPHYSRAQYTKVRKIPLKRAVPGDLVFFLRNGAHHVGIYLGKGRMVDAAGYGKGVRISPISGSWWSRTFTGAGRLLPA